MNSLPADVLRYCLVPYLTLDSLYNLKQCSAHLRQLLNCVDVQRLALEYQKLYLPLYHSMLYTSENYLVVNGHEIHKARLSPFDRYRAMNVRTWKKQLPSFSATYSLSHYGVLRMHKPCVRVVHRWVRDAWITGNGHDLTILTFDGTLLNCTKECVMRRECSQAFYNDNRDEFLIMAKGIVTFISNSSNTLQRRCKLGVLWKKKSLCHVSAYCQFYLIQDSDHDLVCLSSSSALIKWKYSCPERILSATMYSYERFVVVTSKSTWFCSSSGNAPRVRHKKNMHALCLVNRHVLLQDNYVLRLPG